MIDYWRECIAEAFEDAGITASNEQINTVASWVEGASENYGMAHGYDVRRSPVETSKDREIANLKSTIKALENDLLIFMKSVARRRNVPIGNVYLERCGDGEGHVVFDPS